MKTTSFVITAVVGSYLAVVFLLSKEYSPNVMEVTPSPVFTQNPIDARNEYLNMVKQSKCLADNIYFEARNQSNMGQIAVAWVTLNRVDSHEYPNTICEVVWEEKQFSWTHDGKSDEPKDKKAWNNAYRIAIKSIDIFKDGYNEFDPTDGALHYHSIYSKPFWKNKHSFVINIDDHIFYR